MGTFSRCKGKTLVVKLGEVENVFRDKDQYGKVVGNVYTCPITRVEILLVISS